MIGPDVVFIVISFSEISMPIVLRLLLTLSFACCSANVMAARFNIETYGATADDETDDTPAILKTLAVCAEAGGGEVFIPAGTFMVARQKSENPILGISSNTTILGEGAASILKYDPKVNQRNFWRMLGPAGEDCRNITIRNVHLDGSNTFKNYEPGKTPEHNHGIYLQYKDGLIENVTVHDCLIENFSGDCIAIGRGCRNITIRNVSLRNFVRQGIQMGGDSRAHNYLVTGCQDLEGDVRPGGSTIHVEHARGLKNVIIANNHCRHSILAGGVDGLIIRNNIIHGRLVGNNDSNTIVQGNVVRGQDRKGHVMQFGFADGIVIKDNIVTGAHVEAGGIYVWGASSYNPVVSKNVVISGNLIRVAGRGIYLNGVHDGLVHNNAMTNAEMTKHLLVKRSERIDDGEQP